MPILHLNGYKIANPTILARIPHEELEALFIGYGYQPYFVEGDDPERCTSGWHRRSSSASTKSGPFKRTHVTTGDTTRPRWPMIVLRSPKGWTGPKEVDGHKVEDFWRSHQVPVLDPATRDESLKVLEAWMRSYEPDKLFDERGRLIAELRDLRAAGRPAHQRKSACKWRALAQPLTLPDFRDYPST